jgi:hypothetical protein
MPLRRERTPRRAEIVPMQQDRPIHLKPAVADAIRRVLLDAGTLRDKGRQQRIPVRLVVIPEGLNGLLPCDRARGDHRFRQGRSCRCPRGG